jgi:heavy metal sensor kinase
MSLTNRLSAFFLGALALVLVGFSLTLYLLARVYLDRQVDDQLQNALDVLTAATEVQPTGVEWEPQERPLTLGRERGAGQVCWTVLDLYGKPVDRSRNVGSDNPLAELEQAGLLPAGADQVVNYRGQPWRVVQRTIAAPGIPPGVLESDNRKSLEEFDRRSRRQQQYAVLTLVSGVNLEPVQATLRNLAWLLAGLSAGLWLLAALLGRWLCRRALVPLTHMAAAARTMSAADRDQRLPTTASGDEVEDLGRAFNDLLARLQEAYERQRRFTGDASHQLRTPLAAMLGQVEVALRRDRSGDDYRKVLGLVHGQAVQLRQIVEMLLFLARADGEAKLPNLETLDLAAWLADYLRNWNGHPRAADLRGDYPAGVPVWVHVQPALLSQLLDNLLENAWKYSAPGTPVVLRLTAVPGTVTLAVEDAGCGIPAEYLAHVFEPFYRVPPARQAGCPGVGLGLAVVQRIAQAFGGTVSVVSEVGRGSQFRLHLPAQAGTTAGQENGQAAAAEAIDNASGSTKLSNGDGVRR